MSSDDVEVAVDQSGEDEKTEEATHHSRSVGFELLLEGERLPNESVNVAPFELDPLNETEEIVITQYSGEDGCCTDIVVMTNTLDGWKAIDFSWGLEEGSTASDFIKDLDQDGRYEIVLDQIYRIEDGEVSSSECATFDMIGPNKIIKRCSGL